MVGTLKRVRDFLHRHLVASLSGRLLFFTTLFVLLAEVFIYFPSAARYYHDILAGRLASAQVAVLALDEVRDTDLSPELRREILANAGVRLVGLKRNNTRRLYLAESIPPAKDVEVDLRSAGMVELIWSSIDADC